MNGDPGAEKFGGSAKTKSRIRESKGKLLRRECYARCKRQVNSIRNAASLGVGDQGTEFYFKNRLSFDSKAYISRNLRR